MCVNFSFGLFIVVLLWFFGVEYLVLWGIFVGLMCYILYIGNVLLLVVVIVAVVINNLEVIYLIVVFVFIVVLMFICGNFVDLFVYV